MTKLYYSIRRWIRNTPRALKFVWQEFTRGFADHETWSLDTTIAKFALPRLRLFQQIRGGHPYGMTDDEWTGILAELEFFFNAHASGTVYEDGLDWDRMERAGELLGKWYGHLWW